jgi:membrane protease YdiL (CAAX protease family)
MNGAPRVSAGSGRRYIAVILFMSAWISCGWLVRGDPNAYLVLGVPFTVLFQSLIRRRRIRALWVREAPPFRREWKGIAIAAALSVIPLASLADAVIERNSVSGLFNLFSVAGAFGAAYALRQLRREDCRILLACLLITLALDAVQWSLFLGSGIVEISPPAGGTPARVAVGVLSFVQYMAVTFAIEEVTFRMLDGHLHEADRRRGVGSALFISAAWGLWHLPIAGEVTWQALGLLLYVHVPYGVCLSMFWRKSGNLVVPATCHALGDAIRNAILFAG